LQSHGSQVFSGNLTYTNTFLHVADGNINGPDIFVSANGNWFFMLPRQQHGTLQHGCVIQIDDISMLRSDELPGGTNVEVGHGQPGSLAVRAELQGVVSCLVGQVAGCCLGPHFHISS
jgi:hypothetical protein